MTRLDELLYEMTRYDDKDVKRIQHFLKVHEFARLIGLEENLDPYTQEVLEAAAIVHDIGIHKAEEKYGRNTGKYQEMEGPGEARTMLTALSWPLEVIDRVCYLVGHHHTYDNIDGMTTRSLWRRISSSISSRMDPHRTPRRVYLREYSERKAENVCSV